MEPTRTISYPSLAVGIPNTILCFGMAAISVLHLWAYPHDVYKASTPQFMDARDSYTNDERLNTSSDENHLTRQSTQTSTLNRLPWTQAIIHALSFKDVWRGVIQGFHGMTRHHRRTIAGQYTMGEVEGRGRHFKTTKLSEALELINQGSH